MNPEKPTAAVYGYARVSTVKQAEDGESLAAQQRAIRGHAMVLGLEVDHIYVERAASGSTPLAERPQGAAMLAAAKPGDTIITPKLDRMFRSARDALSVLEDLKGRNVSLYMLDLGADPVTGNGISKLVFTILSAVAEAERDRIRERIRDVKRDQKGRNLYLGGSVPFGYRVVKQRSDDGSKEMVLEPIPEEQAALAKAKALRKRGESLRSIELALRKEGFEISHVTIGKALKISEDTEPSAPAQQLTAGRPKRKG